MTAFWNTEQAVAAPINDRSAFDCGQPQFRRLKQFRRVATRYDKLGERFSAFIGSAASVIMAPLKVNTPLAMRTIVSQPDRGL